MAQKKGREVLNAVAKNTETRDENKYFDASMVDPTILEKTKIIDLDLIQKLMKE